MQFFISIPKEVYLDKTVTSQEVMVYGIIYAICVGSPFEESLVTIDQLLFYLNGDIESRKLRATIREAVDNLLYKGKLYGVNEKADSYIISRNQFTYDGNFARVPLNGLIKIAENCNKNKYSIFRYYCAIMGSRHNEEISTMSMSYFMSVLDIGAEKTLIAYNKQLEDLHLIYIERNDQIKKKGDGGICKDTNRYCAWEDKSLLHIDKK